MAGGQASPGARYPDARSRPRLPRHVDVAQLLRRVRKEQRSLPGPRLQVGSAKILRRRLAQYISQMAPQSGADDDGMRSLPNAGDARVPPNVNGELYEATLRMNCRLREPNSCVSTVEPAKDRMCNNISGAFNRARARVGSILAKYEFPVIIIGCEFRNNSP